MFGPFVQKLHDMIKCEAAIVKQEIVLGWTGEIAQFLGQPLAQNRLHGCQVTHGRLRQSIGDDDGPFV